jgi:hypothetical protein
MTLCKDILSLIYLYKDYMETHEKHKKLIKQFKTVKIVYKVPHGYSNRLLVKQLMINKKIHPKLSYNMCNYCNNNWKMCNCLPYEIRLYIDLCYFFLNENKTYRKYYFKSYILK